MTFGAMKRKRTKEIALKHKEPFSFSGSVEKKKIYETNIKMSGKSFLNILPRL